MKITDIKTFNVFTYRTNFVFVKLETDEGISGIGEGTLEYKENALLGAIEDIKRVLIGQDTRARSSASPMSSTAIPTGASARAPERRLRGEHGHVGHQGQGRRGAGV